MGGCGHAAAWGRIGRRLIASYCISRYMRAMTKVQALEHFEDQEHKGSVDESKFLTMFAKMYTECKGFRNSLQVKGIEVSHGNSNDEYLILKEHNKL